MKKIFLIVLTTVLMLSGCSKSIAENDTVKNNIEDVSKYNVSYSSRPGVVENNNYSYYDNIDDLWNTSEYVLIASPIESYAEAEQYWIDDFNNPTDFSSLSLAYSYSVRQFKVQKVYKGEDTKLKEVSVCEHVLVNENEMKVMPGSYPTEQGTKYLLFLRRSNNTGENYFPLIYQGKYSLNDSDNKEQKNISQDMYKQVKEKFKDEIK